MRVYSRQCKNTRSIRDYYEQLYDNKMDNLEALDRFLESSISKTEPGRNRNYEQLSYKLNYIKTVTKILPPKLKPRTR